MSLEQPPLATKEDTDQPVAQVPVTAEIVATAAETVSTAMEEPEASDTELPPLIMFVSDVKEDTKDPESSEKEKTTDKIEKKLYPKEKKSKVTKVTRKETKPIVFETVLIPIGKPLAATVKQPKESEVSYGQEHCGITDSESRKLEIIEPLHETPTSEIYSKPEVSKPLVLPVEVPEEQVKPSIESLKDQEKPLMSKGDHIEISPEEVLTDSAIGMEEPSISEDKSSSEECQKEGIKESTIPSADLLTDTCKEHDTKHDSEPGVRSPSAPASPSHSRMSQSSVTQLITSEVFTRTVDVTSAIEVIYRQPDTSEAKKRVSVTKPPSKQESCEVEASISDTTDSSLSESVSVALPSSSSDHEVGVDITKRKSRSRSPSPGKHVSSSGTSSSPIRQKSCSRTPPSPIRQKSSRTASPASQISASKTPSSPIRQKQRSRTSSPAKLPSLSRTSSPARQITSSRETSPATQASRTTSPSKQIQSSRTPCHTKQMSSTSEPSIAKQSTSTSSPIKQLSSTQTSSPIRQKPVSRTSSPARQMPSSRTSSPARQLSSSRTSSPARQLSSSRTSSPARQLSSSRTSSPAKQMPKSRDSSPAKQTSCMSSPSHVKQISSSRSPSSPVKQISSSRSPSSPIKQISSSRSPSSPVKQVSSSRSPPSPIKHISSSRSPSSPVRKKPCSKEISPTEQLSSKDTTPTKKISSLSELSSTHQTPILSRPSPSKPKTLSDAPIPPKQLTGSRSPSPMSDKMTKFGGSVSPTQFKPQVSEEHISPILEVRAVTPPRIKHKFEYVEDIVEGKDKSDSESEVMQALESMKSGIEDIMSKLTAKVSFLEAQCKSDTTFSMSTLHSLQSQAELLIEEKSRYNKDGSSYRETKTTEGKLGVVPEPREIEGTEVAILSKVSKPMLGDKLPVLSADQDVAFVKVQTMSDAIASQKTCSTEDILPHSAVVSKPLPTLVESVSTLKRSTVESSPHPEKPSKDILEPVGPQVTWSEVSQSPVYPQSPVKKEVSFSEVIDKESTSTSSSDSESEADYALSSDHLPAIDETATDEEEEVIPEYEVAPKPDTDQSPRIVNRKQTEELEVMQLPAELELMEVAGITEARTEESLITEYESSEDKILGMKVTKVYDESHSSAEVSFPFKVSEQLLHKPTEISPTSAKKMVLPGTKECDNLEGATDTKTSSAVSESLEMHEGKVLGSHLPASQWDITYLPEKKGKKPEESLTVQDVEDADDVAPDVNLEKKMQPRSPVTHADSLYISISATTGKPHLEDSQSEDIQGLELKEMSVLQLQEVVDTVPSDMDSQKEFFSPLLPQVREVLPDTEELEVLKERACIEEIYLETETLDKEIYGAMSLVLPEHYQAVHLEVEEESGKDKQISEEDQFSMKKTIDDVSIHILEEIQDLRVCDGKDEEKTLPKQKKEDIGILAKDITVSKTGLDDAGKVVETQALRPGLLPCTSVALIDAEPSASSESVSMDISHPLVSPVKVEPSAHSQLEPEPKKTVEKQAGFVISEQNSHAQEERLDLEESTAKLPTELQDYGLIPEEFQTVVCLYMQEEESKVRFPQTEIRVIDQHMTVEVPRDETDASEISDEITDVTSDETELVKSDKTETEKTEENEDNAQTSTQGVKSLVTSKEDGHSEADDGADGDTEGDADDSSCKLSCMALHSEKTTVPAPQYSDFEVRVVDIVKGTPAEFSPSSKGMFRHGRVHTLISQYEDLSSDDQESSSSYSPSSSPKKTPPTTASSSPSRSSPGAKRSGRPVIIPPTLVSLPVESSEKVPEIEHITGKADLESVLKIYETQETLDMRTRVTSELHSDQTEQDLKSSKTFELVYDDETARTTEVEAELEIGGTAEMVVETPTKELDLIYSSQTKVFEQDLGIEKEVIKYDKKYRLKEQHEASVIVEQTTDLQNSADIVKVLSELEAGDLHRTGLSSVFSKKEKLAGKESGEQMEIKKDSVIVTEEKKELKQLELEEESKVDIKDEEKLQEVQENAKEIELKYSFYTEPAKESSKRELIPVQRSTAFRIFTQECRKSTDAKVEIPGAIIPQEYPIKKNPVFRMFEQKGGLDYRPESQETVMKVSPFFRVFDEKEEKVKKYAQGESPKRSKQFQDKITIFEEFSSPKTQKKEVIDNAGKSEERYEEVLNVVVVEEIAHEKSSSLVSPTTHPPATESERLTTLASTAEALETSKAENEHEVQDHIQSQLEVVPAASVSKKEETFYGSTSVKDGSQGNNYQDSEILFPTHACTMEDKVHGSTWQTRKKAGSERFSLESETTTDREWTDKGIVEKVDAEEVKSVQQAGADHYQSQDPTFCEQYSEEQRGADGTTTSDIRSVRTTTYTTTVIGEDGQPVTTTSTETTQEGSEPDQLRDSMQTVLEQFLSGEKQEQQQQH